MKTLHSIEFRGRDRRWSINTHMTTEESDRLYEDGLEVGEIVGSWPKWVDDIGMKPVWRFFQDLFNFRNPWRKR